MTLRVRKNVLVRTIIGTAGSVLAGFVVWYVMYTHTGKTDPTGDSTYWRVGYPTLIALSAVWGLVLGYPGALFACAMLATQLVCVLFYASLHGPQVPIGFILYVFFAVPLVLAAL